MKRLKNGKMKEIAKKENMIIKIIIMSVSAALVAGAAACSEADPADVPISAEEGDDAPEQVTLQFQQWWEAELPENALREICQQFTEETGIQIELVSDSYENTKDKISAGAAAGRMPDLVATDDAMVYDLAKQGTLSDLTELAASEDYDMEQLSVHTQIDGNAYMIPVVSFGYPLYVNTDVLEQAGIADVPSTWTEFSAACQAVKEKTGAKGCVIQTEDASSLCVSRSILPWLWASGGSVVHDNQLDLVDNQEAQKTLGFLKTLFDNDDITCLAESDEDFISGFLNGNAAFMLPLRDCNTIGAKYITDAGDIQAVPIPVEDDYKEEPQMAAACWGISIAQNCEYQEEAMLFIEFLTGPGINQELATYANAFPCNKYANPDDAEPEDGNPGNAESDDAKPDDQAGSGFLRSCYEIYKNSRPVMELAEIPMNEKMGKEFSEQIYGYFNNDMTTEQELLTSLQEQWADVYQ